MKKAITAILLTLFLASMLSMAFVAPVEATPDSIVGLWHFDEGIGSTASDSSGFGNDGTLSGGKFGNALEFDGVDDYVGLGSNVFSDSDLATYTLEAWINIGSLDSVERRIFDDEGGLRPMLNSGNKLEAFHWDSTLWSGKTVTMATTPTVGIWYHIAQTYDGVNVNFYVNNGLVGSTASAAWEPDDLSRDANIGTIWNTLGRYWKGLIDEVRLSNTAKTSFTLSAAPEVEPGVTVALWHFDDSEGTTLSDASGNGHDGIIYGATWAGPTWTTGKFGQALSFDGDDYVEVAHSASMDVSNSYTFEAWVYLTDDSDYRGLFRRGTRGVLPSEIEIYIHPGWAGRKLVVAHNRANDFGYRYFYTPFPLNQWVHLAVTWDGTTARAYYNGVEQTLTGGPTMVNPAVSDKPSYIGLGYYTAYTQGNTPYMIGLIDEVCIWNKALSADEIKVHAGICTPEWLPPISFKTVYKDGQTVPIKFTIRDIDTGVFISITSLWIEITGNSIDPIIIYCDPTKTTPINNILIQPDVEQYIANWFIGAGTGTFTVKLYAGSTQLLYTVITVR